MKCRKMTKESYQNERNTKIDEMAASDQFDWNVFEKLFKHRPNIDHPIRKPAALIPFLFFYHNKKVKNKTLISKSIFRR